MNLDRLANVDLGLCCFVVAHAVVSLGLGCVKTDALLRGGTRHASREVQPKPQRKRPQGARTGEGVRAAAQNPRRRIRALDVLA